MNEPVRRNHSGVGMADRLIEFADRLRTEGVPIGTSELLDATLALEAIPWREPDDFREAIATTVAKSRRDREVFDLVFDEFFFRATETAALEHEDRDARPQGERLDPELRAEVDMDALSDAVIEAIRSGDESAMADLSRLAIEVFSREGERSGVVGVDLQRIRRGLDLSPADAADAGGDGPTSAERMRFERHLRRELRREQIKRQGELPPPKPLSDLNRALPMRGAADLAEVQRSVARMKRRLATIGHDQRGATRGRVVDFRRTARASLQTGGVPLDLRYRPRRPRKPEIYVLCDVSTSVSSASTFFLSVIHAMHDAFRRLRSFVFIERISEVTGLFESERDFARVSERITAEGGVADVSGYTDYGRVWQAFLEEVSADLGPRSTVIVLGDARTNGRPPATAAFAAVADRANRTYWLNPEPRPYWDYGDSVMNSYEPFCDGAFECWKTEQLEQFVDVIATGKPPVDRAIGRRRRR